MRWDRERWVKLYVNEPADQKRWSVITRAIRDHLLRYVDEEGIIFVRTDNPTEDLLAAMGHVPGHVRDTVGQAIKELLEDGYLVHKGGRLSIRNLKVAQGARSHEAERKAAQRLKKKIATAAGHVPDASGDSAGTIPDDVPTYEESRRDQEPPYPPSEPKPARVESVRETARRAYGEGIRTVVPGPLFAVTDEEAQVLTSAIAANPRWVALRGEMLAQAIRNSAASYARENRDRAKFESGFSPHKWLEWLRSGRSDKPQRSGEDEFARRSREAQLAQLAEAERRNASR